MNTINRTAISNLKLNKGRNIMAGIAILLTTLLVFVVPAIGLGTVDLEMAAANKLYPTFHVMYRNVSVQTAEELSHRAEVETLGLRQDPAQIPVPGGEGWMVYMDDAALTLNKMKLEEGAFPKNGNEIAVSKGLLKAMGISADIGDTIELPYQPVEADGIGYEKKQSFVITGLLPTQDDSEEKKMYSAMVTRDFVEQEQPETVRKYRVMLRVANADSMTTNQIESVYEQIALEMGIAEADIADNHTYLSANYRDPSLYAGIAGILLIVILAGIMTIYSLYYITMIYKVQEFGKMKALGATKRQIRQIVFREGMLVACIAVPLGLITGSIAASLGYGFLTRAYGADNPLTSVIVELIKNHEVTLLKPWMYVMAAAVALFTVLCALIRPMQIAAKISPVEAMRYDGSMKTKKKRRRGHLEMNLLRLTGANLSRNKKRTVMTIVTLSLTGILFMVVSNILSCADPEEIARDSMFDDFQININSTQGDKMHPELEWSAICKDNPLNTDFEKQVMEIPGVEKITKTSLLEVELPEYMDGDETWKTSIIGIPEEYAGKMQQSVKEGSCTYEELQQGDKILVDENMLTYMPGTKIGDTLRIVIRSGNQLISREFQIAAVADMPYGLNHYAFLVLPNSVINELAGLNMDYYWSVAVSPKELKSAEEQLQGIINENGLLEMKSYEEEVAYNEKNTSFLSQICYVFMIVLGSVGIMNLINTMVNSIYVRRRELGIMQAIGLSEKQMLRMLQLEGIFYTAGTLLFSLGIGSLLGYFAYLYARSGRMFGILNYHYPVVQAAVLIAVILTIQIFLTYLIMKNFRKQSMIDRIRFSE